MTLPNGQRVIALDFDGVLNEYYGWNGGRTGEPITGMLQLVNLLRAAGAHVVVFTTRKAETVTPWLKAHGFPDLDVYNEKWSRIDVFVDDRAVAFSPKLVAQPEEFAAHLLKFEPHWRQRRP